MSRNEQLQKARREIAANYVLIQINSQTKAFDRIKIRAIKNGHYDNSLHWFVPTTKTINALWGEK